MTLPPPSEDLVLDQATRRVQRAYASARAQWSSRVGDARDDRALEAMEHAATALEHVAHQRWDEACAACELAIGLAAELGHAEIWSELSILVDEAAAIAHNE